MDTNTFIVTDEQGNEKEMEILFTFQQDQDGYSYVVYTDPTDEEGNVFASRYDEDGNLTPIDSEDEWNMIEEVFLAFMDDKDEGTDDEA